MDKNFSGQNLNGHSFRGQDLHGADFSGCQLKSCDFREADLTGAKFCRATMGINGRRNLLKWASAFMLGVISGFVAWLLNYLFVFAANTIYQSLTGIDIPTEENYVLLSICSLYAASVCLSVFAALKYRDWRIVAGYHLVIILAIVGVGVGVGAGAAAAAAAAAVMTA